MGGRGSAFGRWLTVCAVAALLLGGAGPTTARAGDDGWELIAGAPGCQRVALIFNIGMGNEARMGVLDNLVAMGVSATVFPMGSWTWQNPDLVWQMANQGFVVGSHGDQAIPLTQRGDWEIVQDVRDSFWAIESALGYAPAPYFTPFAADRDARVNAIVAGEGYVPVGWEVTSADWMADASPMSVYRNVMDGVYDGAIVEFHLDAPNTAGSTEVALPWIVADLAAQGYTFVTVPEMASPC
jgi:peptidoglycan/xylan/chitin deacetylase (PgdA/CDA1 family)